ncbi:helix-turn-helix domain-containing protein [Oribacterium sp. FC2011]|uniref:helix-turn-helix domain-containing protein n=1 Tax=Oribacterium sp. FC2011 TaxID=1408311 RepID=UPI0006793767|nr:helix-turn-helix domain-containing protein [Oribacterium sp. FC2011]
MPAVLFWENIVVPNERNIYVDDVYELVYTLLKYKNVFGDESMDISVKIKELRKKTGLSQSKFSAKFGIPVRTLQQWEQGISAPPEYLIRMMEYIMLLEENGQKQDEEPIRGKRADGK